MSETETTPAKGAVFLCNENPPDFRRDLRVVFQKFHAAPFSPMARFNTG